MWVEIPHASFIHPKRECAVQEELDLGWAQSGTRGRYPQPPPITDTTDSPSSPLNWRCWLPQLILKQTNKKTPRQFMSCHCWVCRVRSTTSPSPVLGHTHTQRAWSKGAHMVMNQNKNHLCLTPVHLIWRSWLHDLAITYGHTLQPRGQRTGCPWKGNTWSPWTSQYYLGVPSSLTQCPYL